MGLKQIFDPDNFGPGWQNSFFLGGSLEGLRYVTNVEIWMEFGDPEKWVS